MYARSPCEGRASSSVVVRASENQLQSKLEQARVAYLGEFAERGVTGVAVRAVELRMVKDVVDLGAKFDLQFFADRRVLVKAGVPVVDRGIAAQGARRISEAAKSNCSTRIGTIDGVKRRVVELRRIEDEAVVGTGILGLKSSDQVGSTEAGKLIRSTAL